ncbi:uncharacterized protein LOC115034159 [Acyrthosiphon pisum]|uniref:THAP-type domain-containing protein n=1 Tax=Acyrthosiphon pisum TaxID=7029 RepID=A0A8R2JTB6_ACYPI|nr:uncharacterized protein LOC115034159 [Acyrthosiphon pisum]
MPVCVYEGCFSGSKRQDKKQIPGVHLHTFPKHPELRQKWLQQIQKGTTIKYVNFEKDVVCSLHFSAHHMKEKSYAQKVAGYSPVNNRRLKPDAIPLSVEGIDYDDIPYLRSPLVTTPSGVFSITHFEESSSNKNVQHIYIDKVGEYIISPSGIFTISPIENAGNKKCRVKLFTGDNENVQHNELGLFYSRRHNGYQRKIDMLCFDETYISKRICFDKKNEQVIGPHKSVQTVIARGLTNNWKQPIYYNFDERMTKEILYKIIEELSEIGFNVVGIVSDSGSTNVGLWKSLDISIDNTSFEHPKTNARIHVFADVPHLLKLARNHLLDSGFILPNGKFIGKNILHELLNINYGKDYKFAHKLSERHLFVEGSGRMNVRLAANVFSNSVSKAIAYCGEKNYLDKYNWKEVII